MLLKGSSYGTTTAAPNTAALVGGILGGLLGFILLLGLLILLLCCCCGWGRYRGTGGAIRTANIENTHIAAKSSTLIYPVPFHSISAACLDKIGHYGNHVEVPTLNVATERCFYDPNINTMRSVASARSTSRPEHYLNILTIHRDADDSDGVSVRSVVREANDGGCSSSMPYEIPIINQCADQQQHHTTTSTSRRYVLTDEHQHQHQHQHQAIRNHSDNYRCENNNNQDYYVHSYQQQYEYNQPRYI
jgi:hypothetical protein